MPNLKTGFIWNVLSAVGRQGMMLLGTIILARLLSPEDFGLFGMMTIFITVSETIIDAGLGGALIKKQTVSPIDYCTLTTYNVLASFVLYLLIFFLAPVVAEFYDAVVLVKMLRFYGLTIVIESFAIVPKVLMMKKLQFKQIAITNLISGVFGMIGAIVLALCGVGVYSLIAQYVIMAFVFFVLALVFTKYRLRFAFSFKSFKDLFGFGFNTTLGNVVKNISEGLFFNYFAKIAPLATAGYFNQSTKIQGAVFSLQNSIIDSFIFPVLCKEPTKVTERARVINGLVFLGIAALNVWLILISNEFIEIVLGSVWKPMKHYFCLMLLIGIIQSRIALNRNLLKSLGRTREIVRIEISSIIVAALILICLGKASFYDAIIYGLFMYTIFRLIMSYYFLWLSNSVNVRKEVFDLCSQTLILFVPVVMFYMSGIHFNSEIFSLIIKTIVYIVVSSVLLLATKQWVFIYCISALKSFMKK